MLLNYKYFAKVYYALFVVIGIIVTGTLGFMIVEGWSLLDSFYMTLQTVSTVGFNEIKPLSPEGKIFTSFLIILSFGTFGYVVTAITSYVVSGEYKKYFQEYKTLKTAENMENHTIVCGYGRVGKQAAHDLKFYKKSFVVVERDQEITNDPEFNEITFIKGDSTDDQALLKANISNATSLITALPNDADNLFVVLSARELNPKLKIISRASSYSSMRKLRIAGADNVIMPDTVGGAHMASLVVTPDMMEFMDLIKVSGKSTVNLEEVSFQDLPEAYQNLTIGELENFSKSGCNVIGYRTEEGEYIINPPNDMKITKNSKMFVLGNPEQIKKLNTVLGIS
ncbi:potassium channel protein [Paracrocinitomix mangrovi]|uniref:potassium channel family protein n=1 Tax=Paracrocinitomix mangrovi TaxID=2862509 RepID=UPI001C8D4564|nr:potassium channel protein [Paracrocinitomix mangrovi]UKN01016.1 potassium channel protein [Paracrocinitomix mangrovi]